MKKKIDWNDQNYWDNIGCGYERPVINTYQSYKWFGAFFIMLSPVMAYYQMIPLNFLVLAFGIAVWAYVGLLMRDRALLILNTISVILNILAYINN